MVLRKYQEKFRKLLKKQMKAAWQSRLCVSTGSSAAQCDVLSGIPVDGFPDMPG
jgi:hypothetical protein